MGTITKNYIESHIVNVSTLPNNPFVDKQWSVVMIDGDSIISESDFVNLELTARSKTNDAELVCCLTQFYGASLQGVGVVKEWVSRFTWRDFEESVDTRSAFSYSGMYVVGSSKKWALVYLDGDILVLGGIREFIDKFVSLAGGWGEIQRRCNECCVDKSYAFETDFLSALQVAFCVADHQ